ncbi:AMP-binding protein [Streptomyces sp. C]|uniref:AMP-binding protein n=1 Tax=Streptomyces sp. C TaxID=253839 RepID=UPI0001DEEF51|nr:AMP-binding protein [Streptomyces sp. C]EFL12865.1 predicted protein [Streptomyces sp. C]
MTSSTLAALAHQDVPFEAVVEAVDPVRSAAWHPLFQTVLVFADVGGELPPGPADLDGRPDQRPGTAAAGRGERRGGAAAHGLARRPDRAARGRGPRQSGPHRRPYAADVRPDDERASRLARLLVDRGAGPEVRVAVSLPRPVDLVLAYVAILKAGASGRPPDVSGVLAAFVILGQP